MRKSILMILCAILFVACHNHNHNHNHNHEQNENHEEHDSHEGHNHEIEDSDEIVISPQKANQLGIVSSEIVAKDFVECIPSYGIIETGSEGKISLVAKSSGIIHWIGGKPSSGKAYTKDQKIASLSSKDLIENNSETAAQNNYELAKKQYQRAIKLKEDKIISEREFLEIEANYLNAQNAAANLSEDGVIITSPSNSSIEEIYKNEGDYCLEGEIIASLIVGHQAILKSYLTIDQKDAKILNADFIIGNKLYSTSSLKSISNTIQGSNIPVYFDFINEDNIPIGSYVETYLYSKTKHNTISVPLTALCEEQGDYFVYIQLDEECYTKQKVILGSKNASEVEILSGIKSGDRVVISGAFQVKLSKAAVIPGHSHNH